MAPPPPVVIKKYTIANTYPNTAGHRGNSRPQPSINLTLETTRIKIDSILICTWNVRSLVNETRKIELQHSITKFKWDIIGLSEVKIEGKTIQENDDYIMIYHGETSGRNGVGFLVRKELKSNIVDIKTISDRVIRLDLYFNKKQMHIIQCYAPTESSSLEDLEDFYKDVQIALENTDKNTIVMGDFNSKIGKRTPEEEKVIGPWGYGVRNERGKLLIQFCFENQLYIANSHFKKNEKQKWTWISPDGKTRNEIDFMLVKDINDISDVQVLNSSFPSDHRLVRASVSRHLHKTRSRKKYQPKTSGMNYLEQELLKNIFEEDNVDTESEEIETNYKNIVTSIWDAVRKLPKIKTKDKMKISPIIEKLINERNRLKCKKDKTRAEKNKLKALYKLIKKRIRQDCKAYRYKIIEEELEKRSSVKRAQLRLNTNKPWIMTLQCHNNTISNRDDLIRTATGFYKELYSTDNEIGNLDYAKTKISENVPPFLESEVWNAIRQLKSSKSPGEDGLTNDILKAIIDPLTPLLTQLFNDILIQKKLPKEWGISIVTLLYKKGDPTDLKNYRPISLQQAIYKVFAKLILNRIAGTLDSNQPREQAGFRRTYSTIDHIFTLTQIIEKYTEYDKELYIAFIDYSKAFDSIQHEPLWLALEMQGVEERYIEILQEIYKISIAMIKMEKTGEPFSINRGVKQGDPISPNLFTALLEHIFRQIDWKNMGINVNGEYLNNLRFADDIVILSENHRDLEYMINSLDRESRKCGLKMNTTKTFAMTNAEKIPIKTESHDIGYVDELYILGTQYNISRTNVTRDRA